MDQSMLAQAAKAYDQHYTQRDLSDGPARYVRGFAKENAVKLLHLGVKKELIDMAGRSNFPKFKAIKFCSIPFTNQRTFDLFRDHMPEDVRTVFDTLIWEEKLDRQTAKRRFNIDICEEEDKISYGGRSIKSYQLKEKFLFFLNRRNSSSFHHFSHGYSYGREQTLSLPTGLRAIACQFYQPPEESKLKGLKEINAIHQYTNGERDIFLELPRIIAYANQGQIKVTGKGKPQAATLGKMQRKLNLQEFYPQTKKKELKTVRTSLLAALMVILPKFRNEIPPAEIIKKLISEYYPAKFSSLHGVITYLKGTGYVDGYNTKSVEPALYGVLRALPHQEWISLDNLETYIKYKFLDLNIVTTWMASDKLYYNYEDFDNDDDDYYYVDRHPISESRYHKSLVLPLIKGTMLLFASWGLLDVAYRDVNADEMGKTCQSPYDGLQYIRLNNLGAFVTGKTQNYEISEVIDEETLKLSEDSLTIITPENDATASIILEPYAERVSPNRYRTDYTFFLKGCRSKRDLDNKIKLFKQTVCADLPANWLDFFKELEGKINPFEKVSNVQILKIPSDNPTLIQLIARDKTLKDLCIKAEGYHILVEKTKMSRFKKRLQEFGYLLT